jgi:hypothetical protein
VRPRTGLALLAGLAGFLAYMVAAVSLADAVAHAHWALQALFYLAAGLLWVLPAWGLMLWAARGGRAPP